jgi:resuscitation-promoting factor RpfA
VANGRRPIPPLRAWTAAVLGVFALFVISAGAGMTSWSIVALGLALMILAVSLVMVSAMRGGPKPYVPGAAHVISASEPPSSSRFGRCEMVLVVDAPGLASARINHTDLRVPVAKWPDPGATLPVMVAADDQRRIRILWDDVPTFAEVAAEDQLLGYEDEYSPSPVAEPVFDPADPLDIPMDAPTPRRPTQAASEYDEPSQYAETAPADSPADTDPVEATSTREAAAASADDQPPARADQPRPAPTPAAAAEADETPAQADRAEAPTQAAAAGDHEAAAQADRSGAATGADAEAGEAETVAASAEQEEPEPAERRGPAIVDLTVEPMDPYATDFYPVEDEEPPPPAGDTGASQRTPEPEPAASTGEPGTTEEPSRETPLPRPRPRPRRPRPTNAAPANGTQPRAGAMTAAAAAVAGTAGAAAPMSATGTAVADPEPAEEPANGEAAGGPRVTAIEIDLGELITAYPSARPGSGGTIHGVGITVLVRDLARSVAFYRDMLGFYEIDGGDGNAVLASGDTRVVLRAVHDVPPVNRRMVHLNLEVGDVHAVYEELKAKGVRFTYAPRPVNRGERLELWAAAFRDPDGHGIAITQWRGRSS